MKGARGCRGEELLEPGLEGKPGWRIPWAEPRGASGSCVSLLPQTGSRPSHEAPRTCLCPQSEAPRCCLAWWSLCRQRLLDFQRPLIRAFAHSFTYRDPGSSGCWTDEQRDGQGPTCRYERIRREGFLWPHAWTPGFLIGEIQVLEGSNQELITMAHPLSPEQPGLPSPGLCSFSSPFSSDLPTKESTLVLPVSDS